MPRNRWTVPEFLKDPLQAQGLIQELCYLKDTIPDPDPADPMRHITSQRKSLISWWAAELRNGFVAWSEPGQAQGNDFLDDLERDTAEQH